MWSWLRRTFITGFFVTVPLVVSVVAIVWVVRFADGLTSGLGERLFGGTSRASVSSRRLLIVLVVGAVATNVIGRRVLQRGRDSCCCTCRCSRRSTRRSSSSSRRFRRTTSRVQADGPRRGLGAGLVLGFLTKEFTVDRGHGPEAIAGRVRADEPPVSGRHRHLSAGAGDVSGYDRGRRHSRVPDGRHGAAGRASRGRPRAAQLIGVD